MGWCEASALLPRTALRRLAMKLSHTARLSTL